MKFASCVHLERARKTALQKLQSCIVLCTALRLCRGQIIQVPVLSTFVEMPLVMIPVRCCSLGGPYGAPRASPNHNIIPKADLHRQIIHSL